MYSEMNDIGESDYDIGELDHEIFLNAAYVMNYPMGHAIMIWWRILSVLSLSAKYVFNGYWSTLYIGYIAFPSNGGQLFKKYSLAGVLSLVMLCIYFKCPIYYNVFPAAFCICALHFAYKIYQQGLLKFIGFRALESHEEKFKTFTSLGNVVSLNSNGDICTKITNYEEAKDFFSNAYKYCHAPLPLGRNWSSQFIILDERTDETPGCELQEVDRAIRKALHLLLLSDKENFKELSSSCVSDFTNVSNHIEDKMKKELSLTRLFTDNDLKLLMLKLLLENALITSENGHEINNIHKWLQRFNYNINVLTKRPSEPRYIGNPSFLTVLTKAFFDEFSEAHKTHRRTVKHLKNLGFDSFFEICRALEIKHNYTKTEFDSIANERFLDAFVEMLLMCQIKLSDFIIFVYKQMSDDLYLDQTLKTARFDQNFLAPDIMEEGPAQAVVRESYRLWDLNYFGVLKRTLKVPYKLQRVNYKAGSVVFDGARCKINADSAASSLEFDYERYLAGPNRPERDDEELAFGIGERSCLGKEFAVRAATAFIAVFGRKFKIRPAEGGLSLHRRDIH